MRTAAVTVAQLLLAYELRPDSFHPGDLGLPGNLRSLPDLLLAAAWELRWMLTMQRPDGGVRPAGDGAERIRETDAASFAGAMAIAARVYRRFAPELARAAWQAVYRALAHLAAARPRAEEPRRGRTRARNEVFWAYAEAALTSGLTSYVDAARYYLPVNPRITAIGLEDQTTLGLLAFCRAEAGGVDLRRRMKEAFLVNADRVAARAEQSRYGTALGEAESVRAANRTALAHAVNLLLADYFQPNPRYRRAALDHLHYVLGLNSRGTCFRNDGFLRSPCPPGLGGGLARLTTERCG